MSLSMVAPESPVQASTARGLGRGMSLPSPRAAGAWGRIVHGDRSGLLRQGELVAEDVVGRVDFEALDALVVEGEVLAPQGLHDRPVLLHDLLELPDQGLALGDVRGAFRLRQDAVEVRVRIGT